MQYMKVNEPEYTEITQFWHLQAHDSRNHYKTWMSYGTDKRTLIANDFKHHLLSIQSSKLQIKNVDLSVHKKCFVLIYINTRNKADIQERKINLNTLNSEWYFALNLRTILSCILLGRHKNVYDYQQKNQCYVKQYFIARLCLQINPVWLFETVVNQSRFKTLCK